MSSLEQLRNATESTLHGLTADESLKHRIFQKAAVLQQSETERRSFLRPIPLLCSVLIFLLAGVITLNMIKPVESYGPGEINSFTAGIDESDSISLFSDDFTPDSVIKIESDQFGSVSDRESCISLAGILMKKAVPTERTVPFQRISLSFMTSSDTVYSYDAEPPILVSPDGQCWSCPDFFEEIVNISD